MSNLEKIQKMIYIPTTDVWGIFSNFTSNLFFRTNSFMD